MVEVDPVLDWIRFMDFEEAERYRIEVQQTWARSLGFLGRFMARHYSWFLAAFKRLGWVRISLVLLVCLGALLSRIGVWEKATIIEMAVALSAVGGGLLWCYFLASAMAAPASSRPAASSAPASDSFLTTGMAEMSSVKRVAVSKVRIPRSHRITFSLPSTVM